MAVEEDEQACCFHYFFDIIHNWDDFRSSVPYLSVTHATSGTLTRLPHITRDALQEFHHGGRKRHNRTPITAPKNCQRSGLGLDAL